MRNIEEIYKEAVAARNKYMNLTELKNGSKMSVLNTFTWVVSASIHSFETLLDAFMIDIASIFNSRINGTPAYYANAMLKWQYGDNLSLNEDGTQFYYEQENTEKCIITHVSYQLEYHAEYKDDVLVLKVAKGEGKDMQRLSAGELEAAQSYINQIKFAGVKCNVVSRKGDVLIPAVTVYYDGAVSRDELYSNIEGALENFIEEMKFDSLVYAQKIIDVLQSVDHVVDVYIDPEVPGQGIYIAQYNDSDVLEEKKDIKRKMYSSSGYLRQSTKRDGEADLPKFREAIVLKLEDGNEKL